MKETLLEGEGWLVKEYLEAGTGRPILGVFSDGVYLSEEGCLCVVKQAAKGNADAITAILLCTEDLELRRVISESMK